MIQSKHRIEPSDFVLLRLDPAPSIKYQQEIGRYLLKNVDEAITFLNSLLGQLNWAFSEFMGLLKDVRLIFFSLNRSFFSRF